MGVFINTGTKGVKTPLSHYIDHVLGGDSSFQKVLGTNADICTDQKNIEASTILDNIPLNQCVGNYTTCIDKFSFTIPTLEPNPTEEYAKAIKSSIINFNQDEGITVGWDSHRSYSYTLKLLRGDTLICTVSFAPRISGYRYFRIEMNPAHHSQDDIDVVREVLSVLESYGGDLSELVPTRVDFAVDYPGMTPQELLVYRAKVKQVTSIIKDKGLESVSHLLRGYYLGSPKSSRQIRVYEKNGGTRVELITLPKGGGLSAILDPLFFDSIRMFKMHNIKPKNDEWSRLFRTAVRYEGVNGALLTLDRHHRKRGLALLKETPHLWLPDKMREACRADLDTVMENLGIAAPTQH
jgi:hypothetical protein